jgi:hypothetical protein
VADVEEEEGGSKGGDLGSALRVGDKRPVARGVAGEAVPDAVSAVAVGEAAAVDDFGGYITSCQQCAFAFVVRLMEGGGRRQWF